ncbi:hypothetical protein FORC69_p012 (plasmid) [Escherichia coli]|uniref:Uncharacterized protein n=1 Tax=Escherichia coli TaxID=562 RepID=A0A9P1K231_ECOLX|nr:hypothetical protein FORC29_p019 [Escherichia coli]ATI10972.1 hypothetical protein FORC43_p140 [Escherichia coli]AXV27863.1 hypothetical protein FORC69_p012 [Escherichia coli]CCE21208.1 hypothetical protein HUS41_pII0058 [Escherichia coli]
MPVRQTPGTGPLRLAGNPGRESAPDASSVIYATGGDRVATSQTDRTAWHPDITRDKTWE